MAGKRSAAFLCGCLSLSFFAGAQARRPMTFEDMISILCRRSAQIQTFLLCAWMRRMQSR